MNEAPLPGPRHAADNQQTTLWDVVRAYHWLNLINPRMWIWAFFMTLGALIPVGLLVSWAFSPAAMDTVLGTLAAPIFVVALLATGFKTGHCPECGKANKIGYTRCRACNLDVTGR